MRGHISPRSTGSSLLARTRKPCGILSHFMRQKTWRCRACIARYFTKFCFLASLQRPATIVHNGVEMGRATSVLLFCVAMDPCGIIMFIKNHAFSLTIAIWMTMPLVGRGSAGYRMPRRWSKAFLLPISLLLSWTTCLLSSSRPIH